METKNRIKNQRILSNSEREISKRSFPKTSQSKRELKQIYTSTVYNKYHKFLDCLQSKKTGGISKRQQKVMSQNKENNSGEPKFNRLIKVSQAQIRIKKEKTTRNKQNTNINLCLNSKRFSSPQCDFQHALDTLSGIYKMPKLMISKKIQPKRLIIKPQYFGIHTSQKSHQLFLSNLKQKIGSTQNIIHVQKILKTTPL